MEWKTERMMIWGRTYPELSNRYTETVCTGAVLLDRPGLIRIYPLDVRYMEHKPKKWDIIEAEIAVNPKDSRKESFKINPNSVKFIRNVKLKEWPERASYLLREEHMVYDLEDLEAFQKEEKRSLGIVKPTLIGQVVLEEQSGADEQKFYEKYNKIVNQREMWGAGEKPVPFIRYRPRLDFKCGDKSYKRRVLDWEFIEGSKHHFSKPNPSASFDSKLKKSYFTPNNEVYLIMGNINRFPHTFVIVGVLYPKKEYLNPNLKVTKRKPKKVEKVDDGQGSLFENL